MIIPETHEINGNPRKDMSTDDPKEKPLQNVRKVIGLDDPMLRRQKTDIL